MPPGSRKYELEDVDSILFRYMVIPQNKVVCGEALGVVDTATSTVVLSKACRRIRIVNEARPADCPGVWVSWGVDHTAHEGGRILVTREEPLEILLENPETTFYFRRTRNFGTNNVSVMGAY